LEGEEGLDTKQGALTIKIMAKNGAILGVSDHGGWAVLVTVSREGSLLDRRRVELVDHDLPKIPHHCEAQNLPLEEAIDLITRVRLSAERHSARALEAVSRSLAEAVTGIALRQCPELPPTIAGRIQDYRAKNVADWVMYRQALAKAAAERGWTVYWFDAKQVLAEAAGGEAVQLRESVGPPWNQDHKLAMAAALAMRTLDV
jgi:hypothetical protein